MRARNRGLTLHEVYESDMPKLWADERAIRQICLNFLSNAIKFTPQGGEIWVKAGWTASGGQYLSVKDTGPGIPEEEIPIVLASFGQGSNSIKSAEQGAGLGLPIAKSLIDLHGGTFALKSKLRIGTEVIVTFPPERVMAALPPLAEPAPPIQPQCADRQAQIRSRRRRRRCASCRSSGSDRRCGHGHGRMIAFPAAMLMFATPVCGTQSMTCRQRPPSHRKPVQQGLHGRSGFGPVHRLRAQPCRDRELDRHERRRATPASWLSCRSGSRRCARSPAAPSRA